MSIAHPLSERARVLRRILDRLEHTLPHGDSQRVLGMRAEYWSVLRSLVGREIECEEAAAAGDGEQHDA